MNCPLNNLPLPDADPILNLSAEEARTIAKAFDHLPYTPQEAETVAKVVKAIHEHARLGFGEVTFGFAISSQFAATLEKRGFRVIRRWAWYESDMYGYSLHIINNSPCALTAIQWDLENTNATAYDESYPFTSFTACLEASDADAKRRQEAKDRADKEWKAARAEAVSPSPDTLSNNSGCLKFLGVFAVCQAILIYIFF